MKTFYQNYDYQNPTEQMKFPYQKGKKHKATKSGLKKTSGKSLYTFSKFHCTMKCIAHPKAFFYMMGFLLRMAGLFFFPQHFVKMGLKKIEVKHVDHKIDETVPFVPSKLSVYYDFIGMWLRTLDMMMTRYNYNSGANLAAEWFSYMALIYPEAYKLYSYKMTTTFRPQCDEKKIKKLRKTDPHYMCVPSLHIVTIAMAFAYYRKIFDREGFSQSDKDLWNKELFDRAIDIGESVLYVKQHSVNCIPAGLFMLRKVAPEIFTDKEAKEFLDALFANAPDVKKEDKQEANDYMWKMYNTFVDEGKDETDWVVPVKKWLDNYEPHTPSYNG